MGMASTAQLDASYDACRRIMRFHASTFTLACRLLPPRRRHATWALYGLFRTLDNLVDDTAAGATDAATARAELHRWRAWLEDPTSEPPAHPLVPAFLDTVRRYAIPMRYFVELTEGLESDIENRRYADFAELALYCYRVASTVGLAMCSVLGCTSPAAAGAAAELGVAMQLTNILRDVREDVEQGRVYLPQDELAAAGWSEARLRRGGIDEPFRDLMRRQIARARVYYGRGVAGLPYLSPDARFAILVAARAYAQILREIERRDYDVFAGRVRASLTTKLRTVVTSYIELRRWAAPRGVLVLRPGEPSGAELIARVAPGRVLSTEY
jgi:15-cis-phytoene synthase